MKKMKKFLAFALAMIMCLGMAVTASAENTGKITVKGAITGKKYSVYQIFGATTSDESMSYTVTGEAKTYMEKQVEEDTNDIYSGDTLIFTLVNNDGGDTTNVTIGNAQKAAEWVRAHIADLKPLEAMQTKEAEENTVEFTGLEPGYYYVLSEVGTDDSGSAVMLTSLNSEATVNEKHGTPGFGDKDPDDPDDPVPGKHANKETVEIGETIYYTINYKNALNYVEGALVTQYTIKDTMPTGLELVENTLQVKVNGVLIDFENTSQNGGIEGTISWGTQNTDDEGVVTDTFESYAVAPAIITVEYEVRVTEDIVATDDGTTNTVTIGYNTTDPDKDDADEEKETVYTGSVEINKYAEGNENTKLVATFVIQKKSGANAEDTKDNDKYLKIGTDGKIEWVDDVADATELTTDEGKEDTDYTTGFKTIKGLKAGTYALIETKAPDGYNLLAEAHTFTLGISGTEANLHMVYGANISNTTGSLLPSTGGIGTTIFYVVGGLLVAGAGILLITKKRMSKEQ